MFGRYNTNNIAQTRGLFRKLPVGAGHAAAILIIIVLLIAVVRLDSGRRHPLAVGRVAAAAHMTFRVLPTPCMHPLTTLRRSLQRQRSSHILVLPLARPIEAQAQRL